MGIYMDKLKVCSTTPLQNRIAESRQKLYRVALAWCNDEMLADDLVQDTISTGMKNHKQLRDEKSLFSWICTIMRNNWYAHMRKQKKHDELDDQIETDENGPLVNCHEMDIVQQVRQAVSELPLEQRQLISLVDLGELSYCEVAETLDIPIGTVMSRLHRARKGLLEKIERNQQRPIPAARPIRIIKNI